MILPMFEQHVQFRPKLGFPAGKLVVPATDFSAQPSRYFIQGTGGDVNHAHNRSTVLRTSYRTKFTSRHCHCLRIQLFANFTRSFLQRVSDYTAESWIRRAENPQTASFIRVPPDDGSVHPEAQRQSRSSPHVDPFCQLPAQTNGEANDVCDWDCLHAQLTWVLVRAVV